ncbi:MAG: nucleotidyl transferase AbiEii/AbiGii toxin family protein [bacterium]|nr:nucleotidyl transferase AbiEii/AbiGii toxin family protein [bacterium]
MTLHTDTHKTFLVSILKDIYRDNTVGPILGFKGGTAAFLFYELGRFSVDLDFDLLDPEKEKFVFERMERILAPHGTIKTKRQKFYTIFFELSYGNDDHNIKVEINRRYLGSKYEVRNYLGIAMKVMAQDDMFANKLVAMVERLGRTNRDIYDVWFFLQKHWPINRTLVEKRTGTPFKEFLALGINKLDRLPDRSILAGMGELLDSKQKAWARARLKADALFLLKVMLSNEK